MCKNWHVLKITLHQGNPSRVEQAATMDDKDGRRKGAKPKGNGAGNRKGQGKGRGRGRGRGQHSKASPKKGKANNARGCGRGNGRGRGRGHRESTSNSEAVATPSPKSKKSPGKTPPKPSKTKKASPQKTAGGKAPAAKKAKRTRHGHDDKSFARRAKPSRPDALDQWRAIRDVFNEKIHAKVATPGAHQDSHTHTSCHASMQKQTYK